MQRLALLTHEERLAGRLHAGALLEPSADYPELVAAVPGRGVRSSRKCWLCSTPEVACFAAIASNLAGQGREGHPRSRYWPNNDRSSRSSEPSFLTLFTSGEAGRTIIKSSGAGTRRRLSEIGLGSRPFIQSVALAPSRITGMRL